MELIAKHGETLNMKQVWKFYCGVAKFDSNCTKYEALVRQAQHGPLFSIQCSFESQQLHTCDSVVIDSCFDFKNIYLTVPDFSAMAFVISNTERQCVKKIVLDKCVIGLEGVENPLIQCNSRLSYITTLCYHGYDGGVEELSALNKILRSLVRLKYLDISKTKLTPEKLLALTSELFHPTLQILKLSATELSCAANLVFKVFSSCRNFRNICFSGTSVPCVYSAPFLFYCNCREIDMSFCMLQQIEVEVLSADLEVNCSVTTQLSLVGCGIDDEAVSCLAQGIKCCTALETLELSCNKIGDEGAISLADKSIFRHKLRKLNLACNRITEHGAIAIADVTKAVKTFKLYLWNNDIYWTTMPECVDLHIFQVFVHDGAVDTTLLSNVPQNVIKTSYCKNLSTLSLKGHKLSHGVMELFFAMLKVCSNLKSFTYDSFDKDMHFSSIIDALKCCGQLHTIVLPGMKLRLDDTVILAHFLGKCKHLQKLDVNHSKNLLGMTSSWHMFVPQALDSLSTLFSLNISSCAIGSDGAEALFSGLTFCTSIKELDISSNGINGLTLAEGLARCTNLIRLNINKNPVGDKGAKPLMGALKSCTSLSKLAMVNIRIGRGNIEHVKDAILQLKELHEVTIGEGSIFNDKTVGSLITSLKPIQVNLVHGKNEFYIFIERKHAK